MEQNAAQLQPGASSAQTMQDQLRALLRGHHGYLLRKSAGPLSSILASWFLSEGLKVF